MEYPSSPAAVPRPRLSLPSSPSSLVAAIALAFLFSFLLAGRLASIASCSVTTSSWSGRTPTRSFVVVKTQHCGWFGCTTIVQTRTTTHAR